jgi:hypothetical protein
MPKRIKRNGDNRGSDKQPKMQFDGIDHFVNPQAHNEGKPQRYPDEHYIGADLYNAFLSPRKVE